MTQLVLTYIQQKAIHRVQPNSNNSDGGGGENRDLVYNTVWFFQQQFSLSDPNRVSYSSISVLTPFSISTDATGQGLSLTGLHPLQMPAANGGPTLPTHLSSWLQIWGFPRRRLRFANSLEQLRMWVNPILKITVYYKGYESTAKWRGTQIREGTGKVTQGFHALSRHITLPPPQCGRPPEGSPNLVVQEFLWWFEEFLGSPVVRTLCFHCMGHEFYPGQGTIRSLKMRGVAKGKKKFFFMMVLLRRQDWLNHGPLMNEPNLHPLFLP